MSKYCGNCGAKLEDSARVCGFCGTPLEGASTSVNGSNNNEPQKQEKAQKTVKNVLVGIVVLAIAFAVTKGVIAFTGPKGVVRKAMSAYKSYDIEALTDMASDMYFYYDGMEDFVEYYFEYNVGDDLDYYEEVAGHNCKLSYKINEIYKVSDRKLSELLDSISYEYGDFDVNSIKKIMIADITVTAKSGKKTVNNDLQITLSKEHSGWKILYME